MLATCLWPMCVCPGNPTGIDGRLKQAHQRPNWETPNTETAVIKYSNTLHDIGIGKTF